MNHNNSQLADSTIRRIGALDYHFRWSGGHGSPPVYELSVSRCMPGGASDGIMTIMISGFCAHCFTENHGYRKCVVDALAKQFEAQPPDEMAAKFQKSQRE